MINVYLLRHTYEYGENSEHECTKELGIFSKKKNAEAAIKQYQNLPGFCDFPKKCFIIEKYILDESTWWKEGFFSVEED